MFRKIPVHLFFIGIGVVFLFKSMGLRGARAGQISPATWPYIIIFILLSASIFDLVRTVMSNETEKFDSVIITKSMVYAMCLFIVYSLLLNKAGFLTATFLLLIPSFVLLRCKFRMISIITMSAIVSVSLTMFFGTLFHLPLPRGIGLLRTISSIFY